MKALIVLFAAAVLLPACSGGPPSYPGRTPPAGLLNDPSAIRSGAGLFSGNCAGCHGTLAEGRSPRADSFSPPAPDFREARYDAMDPAFLYWRIATGKNEEPYAGEGSMMPAWEGIFSESQIWNLVAYIRSR